MSARVQEIRFSDQLPACCASSALRLPRPDHAMLDVRGAFGQSETWFAGFDEWHVEIGVSWADDDDVLGDAIRQHVGDSPVDPETVLAAHGVGFDDEGNMSAGELTLLIARLDRPVRGDRRSIETGYDLWEAADEIADDLQRLIGPIVTLRRTADEPLWSPAVSAAWSNAYMTDSAILIRSARVTPVLRGHLLAAWAAAQTIQLFDHGSSLVAALAAPIEARDAVRGIDPEQDELTAEQVELWSAEEERLARHWRTRLGLTSLPDDPAVLTWHTTYRNEDIDRTLALWD